MNPLIRWYQRYFSDPHVVGLALFLIIISGTIWVFGNMLAPVLASVVIAYLLEGFVVKLQRRRVPRLLGVIIVFMLFLIGMILCLVGLIPLLSEQVTALVATFPNALKELIQGGQELVLKLSENLPFLLDNQSSTPEVASAIADRVGIFVDVPVEKVVEAVQPDKLNTAGSFDVNEILVYASKALTDSLRGVLSVFSFQSVVKAISLLVYLVLMPILVFFFMKDKKKIQSWFSRFLPKERGLVSQVWADVDRQIGNYIRGKFMEVLLVGSSTFVTFVFLDVNFATLLAVLVGLSVIIPYVGATVVTIPVMVLGYAQFGWTSDYAWMMAAYFIIQIIDGNVLVPLLFSEVVNLHPVAIIVAILIFGGIWGFWGVFFAIPLATLVQSVLKAWPRPESNLVETTSQQ